MQLVDAFIERTELLLAAAGRVRTEITEASASGRTMVTDKEIEAAYSEFCRVTYEKPRGLTSLESIKAALIAAEQVRAQIESQHGDNIELQEAEQRGFERGVRHAEHVSAGEWWPSSIREAQDMIGKCNSYLRVHVLGDPRKSVSGAND